MRNDSVNMGFAKYMQQNGFMPANVTYKKPKLARNFKKNCPKALLSEAGLLRKAAYKLYRSNVVSIEKELKGTDAFSPISKIRRARKDGTFLWIRQGGDFSEETLEKKLGEKLVRLLNSCWDRGHTDKLIEAIKESGLGEKLYIESIIVKNPNVRLWIKTHLPEGNEPKSYRELISRKRMLNQSPS